MNINGNLIIAGFQAVKHSRYQTKIGFSDGGAVKRDWRLSFYFIESTGFFCQPRLTKAVLQFIQDSVRFQAHMC